MQHLIAHTGKPGEILTAGLLLVPTPAASEPTNAGSPLWIITLPHTAPITIGEPNYYLTEATATEDTPNWLVDEINDEVVVFGGFEESYVIDSDVIDLGGLEPRLSASDFTE